MSEHHPSTPAGDRPQPLSLVVLGWCSIIGLALLLLFMLAMSCQLFSFMSKPQPFLEKYVADAENKKNLAASMAVALEYESMVIRSQAAQITYGFLVGLMLLAAGLLLFAVGAVSEFRFGGDLVGLKVRLYSTAPGLFACLGGVVIISLAVTKDIRRTFSASAQRGTEPSISVDSVLPPSDMKGLIPDSELQGPARDTPRKRDH